MSSGKDREFRESQEKGECSSIVKKYTYLRRENPTYRYWAHVATASRGNTFVGVMRSTESPSGLEFVTTA